jgi:hypothetical protein
LAARLRKRHAAQIADEFLGEFAEGVRLVGHEKEEDGRTRRKEWRVG